MKDLLVILAAASSTHHPPNHHHSPKPIPSSLPSPTPAKTTPPPTPKPPPPLPSTATRPPLFSTVRWDSPASYSTSLRKTHLKYHADLANNLAKDGRFHDFLMISESVVASLSEPSEFLGLLSTELVSAGIARILRKEGKVWSVVQLLRGFDKLGFGALKVFDGLTERKAVAQECRRILKNGGVLEAVELMETLAGEMLRFD